MWGSWVNWMGSACGLFGSRRLPSSPSAFVPPTHTTANPGKEECEETHCVCRTSPGFQMRSMSFASFWRSATEGMSPSSRDIVGLDAKATGPRPAWHLSGPDGAQHDACADPRYARKKQKTCTRHHAPHHSSSIKQSNKTNQTNEQSNNQTNKQ